MYQFFVDLELFGTATDPRILNAELRLQILQFSKRKKLKKVVTFDKMKFSFNITNPEERYTLRC
jgi:hypothetical protein